MNMLVESLKRLYLRHQVSVQKLNEMLDENKISQEEYDYIIEK